MDVRPVPALPVTASRSHRLLAALVVVGAAVVVAPTVRATPAGPRLLAVTATIVAPPDGPPYACRPSYRSPQLRGGIMHRCIHVPVAGVTTPGRAHLVGFYRTGVFYVVAQQPPGPVTLYRPPPSPFCCRSVRAQRVLDDAQHFAREQRERRNPASLPYLATGRDRRPYVWLELTAWTEEVEEFVRSQPPGLLHVSAWLMPAY